MTPTPKSNEQATQQIRILKGSRDTIAVLHNLDLEKPIQDQSKLAYQLYRETADIIFDAFDYPKSPRPATTKAAAEAVS